MLARINLACITKTEVSSFLVIVELCLFLLLLFLVVVLFFEKKKRISQYVCHHVNANFQKFCNECTIYFQIINMKYEKAFHNFCFSQ